LKRVGFAHNREAFEAEALETVGRSARFETTAAEQMTTGLVQGARAGGDLFARLERARPGDKTKGASPPIRTFLISTTVSPA